MVVKIMVPIRIILGGYWGYMGDNEKGNGNYYNGLYDNHPYDFDSSAVVLLPTKSLQIHKLQALNPVDLLP